MAKNELIRLLETLASKYPNRVSLKSLEERGFKPLFLIKAIQTLVLSKRVWVFDNSVTDKIIGYVQVPNMSETLLFGAADEALKLNHSFLITDKGLDFLREEQKHISRMRSDRRNINIQKMIVIAMLAQAGALFIQVAISFIIL